MRRNRVEAASHRVSHNRGIFVGALIVTGVLSVGLAGGCQKTALRPDDTRSQYDHYDQARNQRAEPFLEDEFGRRTPNLSERLLDRSE
jgi:hypothetical protein